MFVEPSLADKLAKDGTYHKWMLAQVKSGNKDALKVFFLNFVFYLKKVFIRMSFFSKGVAMDDPIDGKNPSCNKDGSTGSQQSSSGLVMLQKSSLKCLVFIICIYEFIADCRAGFQAPGSGNS